MSETSPNPADRLRAAAEAAFTIAAHDIAKYGNMDEAGALAIDRALGYTELVAAARDLLAWQDSGVVCALIDGPSGEGSALAAKLARLRAALGGSDADRD